MNFEALKGWTSTQRNVVIAAYLGWTLDAFDFLLLTFVAQDIADGGPLIATLREYVACDLNARRAADNLHIHVNTAHYRLSRIAERTGYDLRSVSDLIEILIAARLADAQLVAAHNRGLPN